MGAIEAKVYKGNTALAAKRGVFVYSTFTLTTFTLFLHLLVHHTIIWNIPPPFFYIYLFFCTLYHLGFILRATNLDQMILEFLIEGSCIYTDIFEVGEGDAVLGSEPISFSTMQEISYLSLF